MIDKAKSMGVKIFSFAAGNYAEGVANLKTLAYRTGGAFYGMSYYLHFASYYASLINIDVDSDTDGLPDYYESNIPIYNGNCIVTSPNIQDTDGDTLKDGDEIIIRKEHIPLTNNVRVYAKMLSDPREPDTDGDGYIDGADENKMEWDVGDRDLAMFAALAYEDGSQYISRLVSIKKSCIFQWYGNEI